MSNSLILLLTVIAFSGCHRHAHTAMQTPESHSPVQPLIVLTKGPCMGTCPVYALSIYEDGRVVFAPRFFTLETDTAYACWRMEEILVAFDQADWPALADSYMEGISDIPTYTLKYRNKKVTWNARAPRVLYDLMALLDRMAIGEGWLEGPQGEEEGPARPGELVIHLRRPEALEELLRRHADQGLVLLRSLDPGGRYVLVAFNERITTAGILMARLRKDPDIVQVSRNREVHPRED